MLAPCCLGLSFSLFHVAEAEQTVFFILLLLKSKFGKS